MKVCLYSTYDRMGGAAVSFLRLAKSLKRIPIDVSSVVQVKSTDFDFVKSKSGYRERLLDRLIPKLEYNALKFFYKNLKKAKFSTSLFINNKQAFKNNNEYIAHFHWAGHGFANIKLLKKINKPIVITLHDMLPITGGCYYSGGCTRYQDHCGHCPVLDSHRKNDISRFILSQKIKHLSDLKMTVIAPSRWMAEHARKSPVLRNSKIVTIPYCIDTDIFKPFDKLSARRILNLPTDKKILLFGAVSGTADERKGFDLLEKSLNVINSKYLNENIHIAIFGQSRKTGDEDKFPCSYLGVVQDDYTLCLIYSAADLFLAPSREENLPNTIMESLACGTPVTAYNTGGIPDLITHKINGYLAAPLNYHEFAEGIIYCLQDEDRLMKLSCSARKKVMENFTEEIVAAKHIDLYKELLNTGSYE